MSLLGAADRACSEQMYEMLHEVMKRADIGTNVGMRYVFDDGVNYTKYFFAENFKFFAFF